MEKGVALSLPRSFLNDIGGKIPKIIGVSLIGIPLPPSHNEGITMNDDRPNLHSYHSSEE